MGILDKLIPENTNIFGATTPTYLKGIVDKDQLDLAKKQSLFQGLLGTALGYIAQPKNQGYGSALPYLAKSYMQGMQMAQSPYDRLERDVVMKEKFDQMELEKQRQKDLANLQGNLYRTEGGGTITTSDYQPINQVGADGTTQIAPSFTPYNVQEVEVPGRKVLNKDALIDYAIKYGDKGGQLVDTLTKLQDMGVQDPVKLEREYADLLSRNDLSEPEIRRRDALATVLSKGPATEITVSPTFSNETGKAELTGLTGELYKNISEGEKVANVMTASNDLATYKNLADAVSKGEFVGGGIFSTPKDFIARLGDELGLGGQDLDTKLANTRKIMKQFANAQLTAGSKLKGPPSEKEQDLLKMAADGKFDEMSPAQIADAMKAGQKVARQTIIEYNKDIDDLIALQESRLKNTPEDQKIKDLLFLLKRKKVKLPASIGKVTIKKK
mgnify:CR=1 FL=1